MYGSNKNCRIKVQCNGCDFCRTRITKADKLEETRTFTIDPIEKCKVPHRKRLHDKQKEQMLNEPKLVQKSINITFNSVFILFILFHFSLFLFLSFCLVSFIRTCTRFLCESGSPFHFYIHGIRLNGMEWNGMNELNWMGSKWRGERLELITWSKLVPYFRIKCRFSSLFLSHMLALSNKNNDKRNISLEKCLPYYEPNRSIMWLRKMKWMK